MTQNFLVRSPFRAKHLVIVQYMAAGPKCPPPTPMARPSYGRQHDWWSGRGQGGPGRIDEQGTIHDITDAARDFALQLP